MPTPVRYARNGSLHIAYQVVGQAALDLLMIPGWVTHLTIEWEEPTYLRFLERLSSFARVTRFDKRGTGLSDRPVGVATMEERMEDARAVMDAAGIERAAILGWSEGGPMALLFAATYPERVRSLVLYGSQARYRRATDYPWRPRDDEIEEMFQFVERDWGRVPMMALGPSGDERYQAWLLRYQQAGASPSAAAALARANHDIDVRDVLESVRVPVLVLGRRGDPIAAPGAVRAMAERIPDARLVELEGDDHTMWLGDANAVLDEVEDFLTGQRPEPEVEGFLATIMVARQTRPAGRPLDLACEEALKSFAAAVPGHLARHGGEEVYAGDDGVAAVFHGTVRAIHCSQALQQEASDRGVALQAGVHIGEVKRVSGSISGAPLRVTEHIATVARRGDVLISATVRDIIAGADLRLVDAGTVAGHGLTERRRLFRVVSDKPSLAEPAMPAPARRLTRREAQVATLVAQGLTNRQIADRLVISERTAEYHVEQIRNKLGFHSRTQVAAWAVEHGSGQA